MCFCFGYWLCVQQYSVKIKDYELEREREKTQLLQEISQQERLSREKIATLEQLNIEQQENLKNEHEKFIANLHNDYKLKFDRLQYKDCRGANSVQREATNTFEVECYKKSDLFRAIEESLVIAKECDQLAIDYNTLLNVCKVN